MIVNGRFLHSEPGGFRRYAVEVSRRLPEARMVSPAKRVARGLPGKLWEQTVLAARSRNDVLWSPTGSGPIRHPRHLVTVHDVAPFVDVASVSGRFGLAQRRLLPSLIRNAATMLVDSAAVGRELTDRFGVSSERLTVAPPGVDDSFREVALISRAEARSSLGRAKLGAVVQMPMVGSLTPPVLGESSSAVVEVPLVGGLISSIPRKNSGDVVDALGILVAEDGVSAAVAGWDGPSRVFGPAQRPRSDLVNDLGTLTDHELALFYRSLDVFVWLPSYEGFGLPIVECAAAGTPVVCTAMPAAVEHLGGNVTIVESASAAVGAVRDLLSDSDRRAETGQRAQAAVSELTWDRTAQSVLRAARSAEEASI